MDIALARAWVHAIATAIDEQKEYLTRLDSAIGDADHGINMQRGFSAVLPAVDALQPATVGEVLVKAGTTLVSTVGGAAGPLYGTAFRSAGKVLTAPSADAEQFLAALTAALEGVQRLGRAELGDKTMVDAFAPAVEAFGKDVAAGYGFSAAADAAAGAAEQGAHATTPLQARKGRASYLGARSIGHQDPGATSTALIFRALAQVAASSS